MAVKREKGIFLSRTRILPLTTLWRQTIFLLSTEHGDSICDCSLELLVHWLIPLKKNKACEWRKQVVRFPCCPRLGCVGLCGMLDLHSAYIVHIIFIPIRKNEIAPCQFPSISYHIVSYRMVYDMKWCKVCYEMMEWYDILHISPETTNLFSVQVLYCHFDCVILLRFLGCFWNWRWRRWGRFLSIVNHFEFNNTSLVSSMWSNYFIFTLEQKVRIVH